MVNEILKSDCIDNIHPLQSKGDVSTFYLDIPQELKKIIKVTKFDADCIKKLFGITHKIADAFFYLKKGGKSQLKDKWIIVENKGKEFATAIKQLEETLKLFEDSTSPISGRIITKRVPNLLSSKDANDYDKLQKVFAEKKGNLRRGNLTLNEKVTSMTESIFS